MELAAHTLRPKMTLARPACESHGRAGPDEPGPGQADIEREGVVSAVVWKLVNTGTTLLAVKAANTVLDGGWRVVTGRPIPLKTNYAKDQTRDLIVYTALSSMLVAAAKVAAERRAIEYYRESTGHLPKSLEPKLSRREKKIQKRRQSQVGRRASTA